MRTSITFYHKGQVIPAVAIYDFKQINDAVLIQPVKETEELGDSILFKFDKRWSSESLLKLFYPATYSDILHQIVDNFKREQILNETYAQKFLS